MDGPVIVLLSGGIDSAVAAALARDSRPSWHALTVDYEQSHRAELLAARHIATALGAKSHRFVECDLRGIAPSPLTGEGEVTCRTLQEIRDDQHTSQMFVPARNLVLASLGVAWAQSIDATEVWIASNLDDRQSFPDCRPEFFDAVSKVAALCTPTEYAYCGVEVRGRLCALHKAEVITLGMEKDVPLERTVSCYQPDGLIHCGRCDACLIRKNGFFVAGVLDPTKYIDPCFADQVMLGYSRSEGSKEA